MFTSLGAWYGAGEWGVQTAGCKMDFKGVLYHVGNIAYIVISVDGV